ncbi:hypothetical protein [Gabonibacter massiliensis]|uniref:hypothetical protein n=1 Tax=Gabonibacter massiliensis TaxID=1720195 RepID=UPI002570F932|nr:hypothetical protein [Gabonibacter massiliensis]
MILQIVNLQSQGITPRGGEVLVGRVVDFRSLPSGTRYAQTIRRVAVPTLEPDTRRSLFIPLRFSPFPL